MILENVPQRVIQSDTDKKLQEISAAEPQLIEGRQGELVTYDIRLPYGCEVSGYIEEGEKGPELYIVYFIMADEFQGHGIGKRLMTKLAEYARAKQVKTVAGHMQSLASLKVFLRIFGQANLEFFNADTEEKVEITAPEVLESYQHLSNKTGGQYGVRLTLDKMAEEVTS